MRVKIFNFFVPYTLLALILFFLIYCGYQIFIVQSNKPQSTTCPIYGQENVISFIY